VYQYMTRRRGGFDGHVCALLRAYDGALALPWRPYQARAYLFFRGRRGASAGLEARMEAFARRTGGAFRFLKVGKP